MCRFIFQGKRAKEGAFSDARQFSKLEKLKTKQRKTLGEYRQGTTKMSVIPRDSVPMKHSVVVFFPAVFFRKTKEAFLRLFQIHRRLKR